ncbi:MAG: HyaD/HybD family hydrogenase maturation endopeptidase [Spirochaetales bacterium]|nr:HyaD/HybD family hydrogenase maturation endopeptidase [Spirochaetales bacterium]
MDRSMTLPVLVMGIGNILLQDEGIGIHVIKELRKIILPEYVELLDGGVGGFGLMAWMDGREKIIFIDAIEAKEQPGTLYRLPFSYGDRFFANQHSLHEQTLRGLVSMVEVLGQSLPEIVLIGVEPARIGWGMSLSPVIAEKIPLLISLVKKEINAFSESECIGENLTLKKDVKYNKP